MEKSSVIALAAAIAITAGSLGIGRVSDTTTSAQNEAKMPAAENALSYEEALQELFSRSMEISDTEIKEIAAQIRPDLSAVEEELGVADAAAISGALWEYEDAKAAYILDGGDTDFSDRSVDTAKDIAQEWKRQSDYTKDGLTEAEVLTSLIPAFDITGCTVSDGAVILDIDEWMTQGYTEGEDVSTENVSAYRYYFTATLEQERDGSWTVSSICNTEQNFTWLEDMEIQEKEFDIAKEDFRGDEESGQEGAIATSTLELYGAGAWKYSADKAVAYADQWATSRNAQYRSYPGVDCSNYVSQSLYAGGIPVSSKWYPGSYSWVNCTGAISYFKNFGTFMSANNNNVLRGNPVYYDWNSNGVYDHTAICVGKNSSGTPIVDSHTSDRYHVSWKMGKGGTRATIQLRTSGTYTDSSTTSKVGSWKKTEGKWYYLSDAGVAVTGWLKYNSKWYYLGSDGVMRTGWVKVNSTWYFLAPNGVMQTGWQKISGKWYYLASNGRMTTGWQKIGGKWYYLASNGAMCTGWQKINSKWYYLAQNGVMLTGIQTIGGSKYYFGTNGAMETGWKTVKGKKYFFSPSQNGKAVTTAWIIEGKTYYFGSDGVLKG